MPLKFGRNSGDAVGRRASGRSPGLLEDFLHRVDDLAALQSLARFVVWVGFEKRAHLVGHAR